MTLTLSGVVFSDLGRASQFMALDWVQQKLRDDLGYDPFPATLNLRPATDADARTWQAAQSELQAIEFMPSHKSFCSARIFLGDIRGAGSADARPVRGAVLLPSVSDYPADKIEIVAPVHLKKHLRVKDGDRLILEFVH